MTQNKSHKFLVLLFGFIKDKLCSKIVITEKYQKNSSLIKSLNTKHMVNRTLSSQVQDKDNFMFVKIKITN